MVLSLMITSSQFIPYANKAFVTLTPLQVFIFLASQWPHYFPGNSSPFGLQECHLSEKPLCMICLVQNWMTTAGFLHLWGQVQPICLLPKASAGSPHDIFGQSLLLWRNKSWLLYNQQLDSGFQEFTSLFKRRRRGRKAMVPTERYGEIVLKEKEHGASGNVSQS